MHYHMQSTFTGSEQWTPLFTADPDREAAAPAYSIECVIRCDLTPLAIHSGRRPPRRIAANVRAPAARAAGASLYQVPRLTSGAHAAPRPYSPHSRDYRSRACSTSLGGMTGLSLTAFSRRSPIDLALIRI